MLCTVSKNSVPAFKTLQPISITTKSVCLDSATCFYNGIYQIYKGPFYLSVCTQVRNCLFGCTEVYMLEMELSCEIRIYVFCPLPIPPCKVWGVSEPARFGSDLFAMHNCAQIPQATRDSRYKLIMECTRKNPGGLVQLCGSRSLEGNPHHN